MSLARVFRPLIALAAVVPVATAGAEDFLRGVTCRATSEQAPGFIDADNLVSDDGLSESPPGSGRWALAPDARGWNSMYGVVGGVRNDEQPLVEFDLQQEQPVRGFRVWNARAGDYGFRGFRDVSVQTSLDGERWRTIPQDFEFAQGPMEGDHFGEVHEFRAPVRARFVRLWCLGTWRGPFGQPDVASLLRVRWLPSAGSPPEAAPSPTPAPVDAGIINVREAPYLAQGDGAADDTAALQQAINDWQASRRPLYFPPGTYLVTKSLRFEPGRMYGDNNIRGAGADRTVLRLADAAFPDPASPQAVLSFGFHGKEGPDGWVSADWFNNNIRDLTIDVGRGNPGAIGLRFYSNNVGSARNLVIRSADGQGAIGLDLGYMDQNGPLLVQGLTVEGFAVGVSCGASVNSQTLNALRLNGQTEAAFRNDGQCVSVAGLIAQGPSPRVDSRYGFLTLVDSELTCTAAAPLPAAVASGEYLYVRDLHTRGFEQAVVSRHPQPQSVAGPDVGEFSSVPVQTLFPGEGGSLRLAAPATPAAPAAPEDRWVNVCEFRRTDELDDTAAVQRAIDSGADVVYFPSYGGCTLTAPVIVRGAVRRLVGFHSQLQCFGGAEPAFIIEDGDAELVSFEDLTNLHTVENRSNRSLVFLNIQGLDGKFLGAGDVFLENTVGDLHVGPQQRVWARHLNSERQGTKIVNDGGQLWILGLKTERGGTLIETRSGGRTELLGGLCYTTGDGKLAPMFVNRDSSVFAVMGEVCYTGDPFTQLVEEERGGVVKRLDRPDAPKRFEFMQGSAVFYAGH